MNGDDETPIPEEVVDLPFAEGELPPAEIPAESDGASPEFLTPGESPEAPEVPADPEAGNAAAAVEEMLSAEVLPEGLEAFPEPAADLPQQPTFQLRLHNVAPSSQTALKRALGALGASVPEATWATGSPVVSQLTEFQLVSLLQVARALGISADPSVVLPNAAPSEEDLALGDLSFIPDPSPTVTESAASIALPKGEKEVMLCTPDQIPGGTVRESFGIVLAHRSIARRIFREEDLRDKLQKELRAVPGRAAQTLPSSHLQIVLRDLMLDLRKAALAKGGNAVLGLKLESFPESGAGDPQLEQLRLVAFGTAAVVDKS